MLRVLMIISPDMKHQKFLMLKKGYLIFLILIFGVAYFDLATFPQIMMLQKRYLKLLTTLSLMNFFNNLLISAIAEYREGILVDFRRRIF